MASELIDFQQDWRSACEEFSDATGIDINGPAPTAQEILAKLDELNEAKDAKSKTTVAKAKKTVGLTLQAVERVGGLVAQGASIAGFGCPANITFNCISFFIDTGFACQKIADNIEDLFSHIGRIMERSQIYGDHGDVIGPEMTGVAHKLLTAVVRTCQKCVAILRPRHVKRGKISRVLKVALFNDDGGVQEQLKLLEAVQNDEERTTMAVTYVATKNISRDMAAGFQHQDAQLTKIAETTKDEHMLAALKRRVGVDDNAVDATNAESRRRRDTFNTDTCTWLQKDLIFTAWSDITMPSAPVLVLQGDEGRGKTHTTTAVDKRLISRHPQGWDDAGRIYVASFYLRDGSQLAGQGVKSEPSIRDVLRNWAGQILATDSIYRRDLFSTVKQAEELNTVEQLMQKLFLEHSGRGSRFFLLLDGTDDLGETGSQELYALISSIASQDPESCSVRLMFTTRSSLREELLDHAPSAITVLDLKEKNSGDMESYISREAKKLRIFRSVSPEIEELKSWVISELSKAVNGDFRVAERTLIVVGDSEAREDIEVVVSRARKGTILSSSIEQAIQGCNRTLRAMEVRHLYCLLTWTIYGGWIPDIKTLESVLSFQAKRESLQPLQKEIEDKYSAFFRLSGDTENPSLSLKYSTSIIEYFEGSPRRVDSANTATSDTLSHGEIQMARHFIEKLCDEVVYRKLGLAEFFEEQAAKSKPSIFVDCDNAHAEIALTCLQALTGDKSKEAGLLVDYAYWRLKELLKLIDLDLINPRLKAEFGLPLVRLFTDPKIIEGSPWEYDDGSIDVILQLLRSSAVSRKVAGSDKEGAKWIKELSSHEEPKIQLFRGVMIVNQRLWLCGFSENQSLDSFTWLLKHHRKMTSVELEPDVSTWPSVQEIRDIYKSASFLDAESDEASKATKLRNLGLTLLTYKYFSEALNDLHDSLELDPNSLNTCDHLANAFASEDKNTSTRPDLMKAIMYVDRVIAGIECNMALQSDLVPDKFRKSAMLRKAYWLEKLGQLSESCHILQEVLQQFPEHPGVRSRLVLLLCKTGRYPAVVEMFQDLDSTMDPVGSTASRLLQFLHSTAFDGEGTHAAIAGAFYQTERVDELLNYYSQAVREMSETDLSSWMAKSVHALLTYYYAAMLNRLGQSQADKDKALCLWESVVEKARKDYDIQHAHVRCAEQLIRSYVPLALAADKDSTVAKTMLDKLRAFAMRLDSDSNDDFGRFYISPAMIRGQLSRYFNGIGNHEKARQELQPDVKVVLQLLSDDDPDNDWQGYNRLGDLLMEYGDLEGARAAWSLIQPIQEAPQVSSCSETTEESAPLDLNTEVEPRCALDNEGGMAHADELRTSTDSLHGTTPLDTSSEPQGPLNLACDGDCGTEWTLPGDFYICRTCNSFFNQECLDKLRDKEFISLTCDGAHEFILCPAWTSASAERALIGRSLLAIVKNGYPTGWTRSSKDGAWLTMTAML